MPQSPVPPSPDALSQNLDGFTDYRASRWSFVEDDECARRRRRRPRPRRRRAPAPVEAPGARARPGAGAGAPFNPRGGPRRHRGRRRRDGRALLQGRGLRQPRLRRVWF